VAQTKKKSSGKGKPAKSAKKAAPTKKAAKPASKPKQKSTSLMKKSSFATAVVKKTTATTRIPNAFKPLDDRLIISVEPMAEKTAGGIFIPGTVSERPSRGTVLAIGPGRRNKKGVVRPLDVSVGDTVLFPQFAGQKIEIGADEFLILREEEVLGIHLA
jgi:chaperonin GroES